jgi:uncharacterized protein
VSEIVTHALVGFLRGHFALDWHGIHGAAHWARVRANGLRLAPHTGANTRVVEAFAFVHDACRRDDGHDPLHGERAAALARVIQGHYLFLGDDELALLEVACIGHSRGAVEGDSTVCTCWDADRLDLGRVAIRPAPHRLCTAAARDPGMLEWAYRRSVGIDEGDVRA